MEGQAGLERLIVKQSGLQEEFFCPKSPKLMKIRLIPEQLVLLDGNPQSWATRKRQYKPMGARGHCSKDSVIQFLRRQRKITRKSAQGSP